MKKVLSYIVLAGLAVLSIASCKREEMAILDPANATAPVLTSFTVEENAIVAEFTPGAFKSDYNKKIALNHALVLVEVDGTKYGKTLNSKVNENTISVSRSDLCKTLMNLGYADGATVSLKMAVRATAQNPSQDNGINGYIDSKSTIDIAAYEIYLPQGGGSGPQIPKIDLSQYEYLAVMEGAETWGIIGPAVSDWSTDVDLKKISNDPEVWYASSVPFAADSFKFRGNDEWGDYDLGGGEYALNTPIVMSKGGGDMTSDAGSFDVYLFPTYGVAYITAGTGGNELPDIDLSAYDYLDIMEGAETWGVIGPAVSDWSTDVDLEKISDDPEIWCAKGMPFQSDSFKFRGNDTWADYDLGGGVFAVEEPIVMTKGGGDMTAEAGNYDVYLYPTYGVAYLKPAGGDTPPPPEKPKAWSLIGTLDGTSWDTDFDLENVSGNTWVIKNVAITEADEFKIRADHDWGKSVGGPEENDQSTIDPENPYGVYKPVLGETFTAGGANIRIGVEGVYNITLNYGANESTILIEEYKEFPDHVYMIGADFGGWDWGSDGIVELVPVVHQPAWGANAEGQFWTVKYLKAGSDHGFKFCSKREWSGDFWGLEENDGFVEDGGNCTVSQDGHYLIHIDFKNGKVHIEPARVYGIGACWGGKWDENMEEALFKADGEKLKVTVPAGGELRMYVASEIATSDWWTREFIFFEDGVIDYRGDDEGQGDQGRVNVLENQVIVLDFNAGTGSIEGEGVEPEPPAAMYMIGAQFGNWDWNSADIVELVPVWGTETYFWCTRWFDSTKGFKFCGQKAWNGDFTGEGDEVYTVADGNCWVPADGLYTVLVNSADNSVQITEAEVYGLGDAVFTGGWDFDTAQKFEVEGDKFVLTTSGAGELRLSSKVMPAAPIDGVTTGGGWIDWWKTEFIFFEDCKIDYRGAGPDQARRQVEAGQKIVIDFNAGTAYFEGEVPPPPVNVDITIDGDMSDWAAVPAGLSSEEGPYLEFKATNDDEFIYLYSKRTWHDGLWKDSSGGYYYFEFDTDNDSSTGTTDVNGNTGFGVEAWMYLYLFTGTAAAPTFASNPAGSGYPSSAVIENILSAGFTDMTNIETEVRIPLANIGVAKGQTIKIYTWGNKSAGNLKGEDSYLQITIQ